MTQFVDSMELLDLIKHLQQKVQTQSSALEENHQALQHALAHQKTTEVKLLQARDQLEQQVETRTTELAQINEKLQESEQRFRAIFDSTFQFIGLLRTDGTVIEANRTALNAIGATRDQIIGQAFWATPWWTHSPDLQIQLRQGVIQAATGQLVRFEAKHFLADGTFIIVDFSLSPIFDEQGNVVMLIPEGRDITEKKQLENQILRTQRLESIGTLASGIAHDMNNVLTPILAASQLLLLKLPDLDGQNQTLLRMVEDSARRGSSLIQQILAFARGSDGIRIPAQIAPILTEVAEVARQTFPDSIALHIDLKDNLAKISADRTQLYQVFMNLLINARDAMPNGGTITLSAENLVIDQPYARMNLEATVGPHIQITITDTGTGIPPEFLDRIFDPFFTTKASGKGTGLGLSTTLGIVQSHGGFLQVDSTLGQGTCFKIYLPALVD
jgi:two-component system, cell cycle sensor histidine kinase and response regulator CckA